MSPKSVAVVGGGAWCRAVIAQLAKFGFKGDVWPVHPKGGDIDGNRVYSGINDLPSPPDATFIGVNRDATIDVVEALSKRGAGGAVCFASGFAEVTDGDDRNAALLSAAGMMPILGPNCYGLINACDGAVLWPDQHGCVRVKSGVAILTQSSNIAINLTMQGRALPISYVVTCGNQAQTSQATIALTLLDDPRVTAIGLHIEGFGDLAAWQALARKAKAKGIPLVALKVGASTEAQIATISHTASLAGSAAGAKALLDRFGILQVNDLAVFLETLKILHVAGPLASTNIASISCSGGEASLAADMAKAAGLRFPPLNDFQTERLSRVLGPKVTLANPLDYHTYIWRDVAAMTNAFCAMIDPVLALTLLIVDFPRNDRCDPADWDCVIAAALETKARAGGNIAMVATLPELMPEHVAQLLLEGGVIPLSGLATTFDAIKAAQISATPDLALDIPAQTAPADPKTLSEANAKHALAKHGIQIPRLVRSAKNDGFGDLDLSFPVVLKGEGFDHKSEAGAVVLNLKDEAAIADAAATMQADSYLVEEMVTGGVAELLVGVTNDPAHGLTLTIGAGGVLTELLTDTVSLIIPFTEGSVKQSLTKLKIHKILVGYRNQPAADMDSITHAIMAVQDYVLANVDTVSEVEINPLICTPTRAIAVDALIRKAL